MPRRLGLEGAQAFVTARAEARAAVMNVNLDMVSRNDRNETRFGTRFGTRLMRRVSLWFHHRIAAVRDTLAVSSPISIARERG
jgi:hypothetical protein